MTSIDPSAFNGCTGLKKINVSTNNAEYASADGVLYDKAKTKIIHVPKSIQGAVSIPDGVTSIGDWAFSGCKGLTSITIPAGVTSIGYDAFRGCTGLTSVTIGSGVTGIGDCVFYGCSGLTSIVIPDSVTSIGDYAFRGCTGLTSITIPDSVTSIGDDAFYGCSELTSIYYTGDVAGWCGISGCGGLMSSSRTLYIGGNKVEGKLIIPNSVASIGDYAFSGCTGLTSITISDSVTSIGNHAFLGCTGLTNIYYTGDIASWCGISGLYYLVNSSGTLYIGGNKVEGELIIPDGMTSIGDYAFYGCSGLTNITIPDSVTSIGYYAFYGCTVLTDINYKGTKAQWNAISKGYEWNCNVPSTCKIVCTDGTI